MNRIQVGTLVRVQLPLVIGKTFPYKAIGRTGVVVEEISHGCGGLVRLTSGETLVMYANELQVLALSGQEHVLDAVADRLYAEITK